MDIITRIVEILEDGETFCLATIVESGSKDATLGKRAIVLNDGSLQGSIGSTQLDSELSILSQTALRKNKSHIVQLKEKSRVFLNIISCEAQLLLCGAGHIAVPLAQFATRVGFRVTVLDDRPDFAHPSRFPDCEVVAEDFAFALREIPLSRNAYVVIITRGHVHDKECLSEILKKKATYVGLIGSRRRVRMVLETLEKEGGIPKEKLNTVFTPIGLPIGAESPEEIALSIVSELVCVRRKGSRQARALRTVVGVDL